MANSVYPDQTAPKGAVWSGSTLFTQQLSTSIQCQYGNILHISDYTVIALFITNCQIQFFWHTDIILGGMS